MKNILIIFFMVLVIMVLYGLNEEFGWITIDFQAIALGVAGGAGPLQYLRGLSEQKKEEQKLEENRLKYRTLTHQQFVEREKAKSPAQPQPATQVLVPTQEVKNEPFNNPNALG